MRARLLPGWLYLHDLALSAGAARNAVGQNAVVRIGEGGQGFADVWWPRWPREVGRAHPANYLQLNSIAAGASLATSYFSASTDDIRGAGPVTANFPVDAAGGVLGRDARAGRARADAAALRASAGRTGLGGQQRLRRGRGSTRALSRRWRRCPAGRAGSASTSAWRSSARRACSPASGSTRPGSTRPRVCGVHAVDAESGRGAGKPDLARRQPDLRRRVGPGRAEACVRARSAARCFRLRPSGAPAIRRGRAEGAGMFYGVELRRRSEEHERFPAADARRDVRERRQHDAPVPRRPSAALRLSRSSRSSGRAWSTTR